MTPSVFKFEAIGTSWVIEVFQDVQKESLLEKIRNRIDVFDRDYSRFRSDSLVTRMSKATGTYRLPPDAKPMLDIYERMYKLTGGSMTPLIGRVMEDAGYDAEYSLKTKATITQPPAWNEAIEYSFPDISIKQPVVLDFGAAGKGYLIDIVANILKEEGVKEFTIDAGGDIVRQSSSEEKLRVGLENPEDTTSVIGVVSLGNGSICGSAGNRRAWGEYHHIIDPYTLKSPRHLLATWVVAENALLGDALASALFFVGAKVLQAEYNFEYLVLHADNSIEKSEGFPGEVFIKE